MREMSLQPFFAPPYLSWQLLGFDTTYDDVLCYDGAYKSIRLPRTESSLLLLLRNYNYEYMVATDFQRQLDNSPYYRHTSSDGATIAVCGWHPVAIAALKDGEMARRPNLAEMTTSLDQMPSNYGS